MASDSVKVCFPLFVIYTNNYCNCYNAHIQYHDKKTRKVTSIFCITCSGHSRVVHMYHPTTSFSVSRMVFTCTVLDESKGAIFISTAIGRWSLAISESCFGLSSIDFHRRLCCCSLVEFNLALWRDASQPARLIPNSLLFQFFLGELLLLVAVGCVSGSGFQDQITRHTPCNTTISYNTEFADPWHHWSSNNRTRIQTPVEIHCKYQFQTLQHVLLPKRISEHHRTSILDPFWTEFCLPLW